MDGYRKSFQYIQDYININSLKIWHEEVRELHDSNMFTNKKMFIHIKYFLYIYYRLHIS